jgi:hypothetical protein
VGSPPGAPPHSSDIFIRGRTSEPRQTGRPAAFLLLIEPAKIDFAKIADGSLDATILERANGAKALGKTFLLDFAAEMNGDEAWSGNNAQLYVSAYRHIDDIFVAAGATNVVWAWCPNVTDTHGGIGPRWIITQGTHTLIGPGWMSTTGVQGRRLVEFEQVLKNIYALLTAKKKPILIGEMASSQAGRDNAKWIDEIIPTLRRAPAH